MSRAFWAAEMRCAADLHIHSCLSPCADDDMTPCNIAGMAALKGLRLIAVTDHNSARNLPAAWAAAEAAGLSLVPGIELTTREEVHLLAYFADVDAALAFGDEIYRHLPDIPNRPQLFGEQRVMDERDRLVAAEGRLLISALDLTVDQLAGRIARLGGAAVPAHVNRGANGILQALGFVPPGIPFSAIEAWRGLPMPPGTPARLPVLHSSDAHRLGDILEAEVEYDLPTQDAPGFLQWLRQMQRTD
ncbi:MAG: PHP domain-containing protein [Clostridiales bacterium]|nr:PHP domain-containing protein [Clostridiales bacterium]